MSTYRIRTLPGAVEARQMAVFPFVMGSASLVGGSLGIFLWADGPQAASGLDYWMPLLICVGAVSGGLYLALLHPTFMRVVFMTGSNQLLAADRALALGGTRTLFHDGLDTFSIQECETDGVWYTPQIRLTDGRAFKVGFGCPSALSAQSVIDQIAAAYARASTARHVRALKGPG